MYTKQTKEQNADGSYETITADFRKYACVEDSIADHSAYLLGAMNGSKKRYVGIAGMTDYKKVVQFIKDVAEEILGRLLTEGYLAADVSCRWAYG